MKKKYKPEHKRKCQLSKYNSPAFVNWKQFIRFLIFTNFRTRRQTRASRLQN